ncbi:MAG: hypothetical protein A2X49_03105 [Lentisphaerae bacterium GWF2_52_8]|nr:MAG: hypothetical protein A2X49_03105 [Lentisphaerae bacterium GWF2_52_8]
MRKNILDHLWLWCHPASCYNGRWNLPGESSFSPLEAASYMGIKNAVMVVFCNEPLPPFNDYARQFRMMDKVVWSVIGDGGSIRNNDMTDIEHVVDLKNNLPNLQGGIMDDFFGHGRDCDVEKIKKISDRLHALGLELWIVLYGHQLEIPYLKDYLDLCDVVSFWTWRAKELPLLEERLETLHSLVPGKKIALGCYMWDFGDSKPISISNMEYQCTLALKKYKNEQISDIVMLGSPLCGMDIEAVKWTKDWIALL